MTETWTDLNTENTINIPGYNKIIKSRNKLIASRGGGVALFISTDLAVDVKLRPLLYLVLMMAFLKASLFKFHKHIFQLKILLSVLFIVNLVLVYQFSMIILRQLWIGSTEKIDPVISWAILISIYLTPIIAINYF